VACRAALAIRVLRLKRNIIDRWPIALRVRASPVRSAGLGWSLHSHPKLDWAMKNSEQVAPRRSVERNLNSRRVRREFSRYPYHSLSGATSFDPNCADGEPVILNHRRVDTMPTDSPGASTVLDPGLAEEQEKDLDTSGPRIRCPLCGWPPRKEDHWLCSCGHEWNTFDTGGVCPACLHHWTETQCLSCSRWSPHSDWYAK